MHVSKCLQQGLNLQTASGFDPREALEGPPEFKGFIKKSLPLEQADWGLEHEVNGIPLLPIHSSQTHPTPWAVPSDSESHSSIDRGGRILIAYQGHFCTEFFCYLSISLEDVDNLILIGSGNAWYHRFISLRFFALDGTKWYWKFTLLLTISAGSDPCSHFRKVQSPSLFWLSNLDCKTLF